MSYTPKTVLITGATSDFGAAFAQRFAGLGANLVLSARNAEKLDTIITDIKANHTDITITPMICDMSSSDEICAAFADLDSDAQNIDLLINNAGGALGLDPFHKADINDLEAMISVNNTGLITITRLVIEGMVRRKAGHIINIGSVAGNYPYGGGHVYCASKAFTKQFSLALRSDLVGTKVRVTNIEPGLVKTGFSLSRFKGDKEKADAVYANTENITADDIAESVVWAATLPPRMNVNRIEIMPTTQYFGGLPVERFD